MSKPQVVKGRIWNKALMLIPIVISQLFFVLTLAGSTPASASTTSPPYRPTNVNAIPLLQAVQVTWSPPTYDGSYPVSEYLIDLDSPDGTVQQVITSPTANQYTFNTLYSGQTYIAFIYAISAGGVSAPGETPSVTATSYPSNAGNVVASAATPDGLGYYEATSNGYIFTFGDAQYYGSMGGTSLTRPITAMTIDPATGGYWLVGGDGGIFSFNAPFFGSYYSIGVTWVTDAVGITAVEGGNDYCVSEANGYIHCFGLNVSNGAAIFGSPQTQGLNLNASISGIAATSNGQGYWETALDGGVFTYGNAGFYGSMGNQVLNKPVVGIAPDPSTGGYWLVASDGGVFSFNAPFYGSMGNQTLNKPMVSIAPPESGAQNAGGGYWLMAGDGGVFTFGGISFYGSAASSGSSGSGNGASTNSNTVLWGLDSVSNVTSPPCGLTGISLGSVDSQLGTPQFYGRYVTLGALAGSPMGTCEADYIHQNNIKLLLLASPAATNLTTVAQANTDANSAIASAKNLGAPPGTAIFRDIENGYTVNAGYLETWTQDMLNAQYTPGFYENPNGDTQGQFSYAYNAAYNQDSSAISQTVLYSSEPEPLYPSNYYGTKAGSPQTFTPNLPTKSTGAVVPNTTIAWQYAESQYFPGQYGPYGINVDPDEYNGNYSNLLW